MIDFIREAMAKFASEIKLDGMWWFIFGMAGQVAFTGRFLFQWIVSEREKKSIVPVYFWYLSLIGASMLLVYFIKRGEAVGAIGQTFGWFVYLRNLMLIHRERHASAQEPA